MKAPSPEGLAAVSALCCCVINTIKEISGFNKILKCRQHFGFGIWHGANPSALPGRGDGSFFSQLNSPILDWSLVPSGAGFPTASFGNTSLLCSCTGMGNEENSLCTKHSLCLMGALSSAES